MEIWDLYTKDREKTNQTMIRGENVPEGFYRLAVTVCIFNSEGKMLIQQRVSFKDDWPNLWDVSCAGSSISGDTSQTAAEREVLEELGLKINLENERPHLTNYFADGFNDIYILNMDLDLSKLKLHMFENDINNLLVDVGEQEIVKISENDIKLGKGSVFIVSDPRNLEKYNTLSKIPKHLFYCNSKINTDCMLISPSAVPNDAERIVYLDKPMQPQNFSGKAYYLSDQIGYNVLDEVSLERSTFAEMFSVLKDNCGKQFTSATDFFNKHICKGNGLEFVLATTVFLELGIFKVVDGVIEHDLKVKNPLTNSKVYSKICVLKG
jgi:isopentenyldiphosphate isomerase